jgi:hypothetical protein
MAAALTVQLCSVDENVFEKRNILYGFNSIGINSGCNWGGGGVTKFVADLFI